MPPPRLTLLKRQTALLFNKINNNAFIMTINNGNKKRGYAGHNIKAQISQHLDSTAKHYSEQLETAETLPFDKYWEDIMRTDKDPDYKFDLHALPMKTPHEIESESKRLLAGALKGGLSSTSGGGGDDHGDVSRKLNGFKCADFYQRLDKAGRTIFLKVLAKEFGPDHELILTKSDALKNARTRKEKNVSKWEQELRDALEPRFLGFFTQIYQHPGGMRFIVKMREDLLSVLPKSNADPDLKHMNELLKRKMQDWFGISFLDLERITWSSPAEVLEKIKYEAVHAVPSWDALKERLLPGRACYAFFHKAMPLEPLAFIHVSFENEIQQSISSIIHHPPKIRPQDASVAIFYTISSPQKGLSGIDLGHLLIKRAVKEIQSKLPHIKTFTTLSPIPGFRNWLDTRMNLEVDESESSATSGNIHRLLLPHEIGEIKQALNSLNLGGVEGAADVNGILSLKILLETPQTSWPLHVQQILEPILIRLCSRYLLLEKKRTMALDPVANFHIRNGACVYQLNWMGDTSEKGIEQSFGIMVNYLYDLKSLEVNREGYVAGGGVIAVSESGQFQWSCGEARAASLLGRAFSPVIRVLDVPSKL
ncbi:malonyl-CoA decarboxylase-domain-containing protein [Obelidium mucronatum]|nr:malonyl-CoA decarboxylase-domain-containing protein [Obelidium mucronatum]